MTKKEVQARVLQDGKPLDIDKFEWDEKTNTFSSEEDGLVIDFKGVNGCAFNTGSGCTFDTGGGCTFDTGSGCTFNTGSDCTFKTGENCVIVRRDVYEVIETNKLNLTGTQSIKLNRYRLNGYTIIDDAPKHKIVIDGKEIEISEESFKALKDSLIK